MTARVPADVRTFSSCPTLNNHFVVDKKGQTVWRVTNFTSIDLQQPIDKLINQGLVFILEFVMLSAFAYYGFNGYGNIMARFPYGIILVLAQSPFFLFHYLRS
jgi:hypothetical protein